jgi:ABC-type nitrate/sulfonate/bicarbonate transport system permease component
MTSIEPAGHGAQLLGRVVQWIAPVIGVALLWQGVSSGLDSIFFPPPTEIWSHVWSDYLSGPATRLGLGDVVFDHVLPSLWRMFRGWGFAVVSGVLWGLLFGLRPAWRSWVDPVLQFGRAIPPPLVLGVLFITFGNGDWPKAGLIAFGSVWPVLFNTIDGVATVSEVRIAAGRTFGWGRRERIARIIVPDAAPSIMAGVRASLGIALILMVLTEFIGATNGLGYTLVQAQRSFAFDEMWAGLVVLSILGLVLNTLLLILERRVLRIEPDAGVTGGG